MRKPAGQARLRQPALPLRERALPWLKLTAQAGLLLTLSGALSLGVTWMRNPHNMPLRSVQIEGEFRKLNAEQLQVAVADKARGGFFSVNVDAVRRAVEALPWVASATVRRVWPDRLQVHVVEQRAAARWGDTGVLNMSGHLFTPEAATIPPRLPRLAGPDELRRRVMESYIEMTAALVPIGLRVAELRVDNRRAWLLRLDDGVELHLGRDDALARLERFVRVYPTVFAAHAAALETVDLRYSNGFAVRWDRSPETAGQRQEG
jgi:cell division protein FtsQ